MGFRQVLVSAAKAPLGKQSHGPSWSWRWRPRHASTYNIRGTKWTSEISPAQRPNAPRHLWLSTSSNDSHQISLSPPNVDCGAEVPESCSIDEEANEKAGGYITCFPRRTLLHFFRPQLEASSYSISNAGYDVFVQDRLLYHRPGVNCLGSTGWNQHGREPSCSPLPEVHKGRMYYCQYRCGTRR